MRTSLRMRFRSFASAALFLASTALMASAAADPTPSLQARLADSGKVDSGLIAALAGGVERIRALAIFRVADTEKVAGGEEYLDAAVQRRLENTADAILGRLTVEHFELARRFGAINALAGWVTAEGLLELVDDPRIVRVGLDAGGHGHLAQAVPLVNLDTVQGMGLTGAGIQVAILDSGADNSHMDTGDAVIAEECFCSGGGGCCPGGGATQSGAGSAQDDHGHGTNVTGVVTSDGDVAAVGGAPDAEIVSIKVLDSSNSFCCTSDVVAGLDWIIMNRPDVDVVNMSLGTSALYTGDCDAADAFTMAYATAINTLRAADVLSTVSAGNNASGTQMSAPACIAGAISVGAVYDANIGAQTYSECNDASSMADQVTCFSNSNASTDVFAPGAATTSAGLGGGTSTFFGTSQAAPMVAACVAALLELRPTSTAAELEAAVEGSTVTVTDATNGLSFPRLDCAQAVADVPVELMAFSVE